MPGQLSMLVHRLLGTAKVRRHGVWIDTHPDRNAKSLRNAIYKGRYESHECALVKACLRPEDRVVEIGCGIGVVGLVARRVCTRGRVISYEANPALEPVIRRNFALNGMEPELVMKAVTADGRDLVFHQDPSVLSSSAYDRDLGHAAITVPSIAIGEVIATHAPTALIMDVEGSEDELLRAADLSGVRVAIVEMHPHIIGEARVAELVEVMRAKGLACVETRHKTFLFAR